MPASCFAKTPTASGITFSVRGWRPYLKENSMDPQHTTNTRMLEAVNQGENLADLLNSLFRTHDKCQNLLSPAIVMLTRCYQAARDTGQIANQPDAELDKFMAGSFERILFELNVSINSDCALASRQLGALVFALNAFREAGFRWSVTARSQPPIPVAVVEMPARVTTSEVRRDPSTNSITGSVQTEKDSSKSGCS